MKNPIYEWFKQNEKDIASIDPITLIISIGVIGVTMYILNIIVISKIT